MNRCDKKCSHYYGSYSRYPEVEIPDELKDPSPSTTTQKVHGNASQTVAGPTGVQVKVISKIEEINRPAVADDKKLVETAGAVLSTDNTIDDISSKTLLVLISENSTSLQESRNVRYENETQTT